jgi:hypothetical protein
MFGREIMGQPANPQDAKKLQTLAKIGTHLSSDAEVRLNACNVAQATDKDRQDFMLALLRLMKASRVTANDNWVVGTGTGQWWTTNETGTGVEFDSRWGANPQLGEFLFTLYRITPFWSGWGRPPMTPYKQ